MTTWMKVARYHLVDRINYLILPWGILAFAFLVTLAILAAAGAARHPQSPSGALFSIYIFFFVLGMLNTFRSLPFGLVLGASRRSYYAGTALLAVSLAAMYGLALAVLQVIERATGGWGMTLHFFRVAYIFDGPWYLTWLTSFVSLTLLFTYGMWFGLVYRRWSLPGLLAFIAAQVTVIVVMVVTASRAHAWQAVGHFFITLSAAGLTGLLAALAVVLLAGGYATMRHATV
jgi:hypothetical protein